MHAVLSFRFQDREAAAAAVAGATAKAAKVTGDARIPIAGIPILHGGINAIDATKINLKGPAAATAIDVEAVMIETDVVAEVSEEIEVEVEVLVAEEDAVAVLEVDAEEGKKCFQVSYLIMFVLLLCKFVFAVLLRVISFVRNTAFFLRGEITSAHYCTILNDDNWKGCAVNTNITVRMHNEHKFSGGNSP